MPSVFTTLQSSRFLDQDAAIEALKACAHEAKAACDLVVAVHLFGSLAAGTATPRSDADVVVEVPSEAVRKAAQEIAARAFLGAPLPVDLFVCSTSALAKEQGIAGALARRSIKLA